MIYFLPYFLRKDRWRIVKDFKTIEDLKNEYGNNALIPINNILQVKFYALRGIQPLLVYPSEKEKCEGKLTFWYTKDSTQKLYIEYRKYMSDKYNESGVNN